MTSIYSNTPFAAALVAKRQAMNRLKGISLLFCTDTAEIPVTGRPGKTVFRQFDTHGVSVIEYRRDYLIAVEQLRDPDTQELIVPVDGHRIKEQTGPQAFTVYEIRPVGTEPAVRFSDTTETEYRIHTLRVETLTEPTP